MKKILTTAILLLSSQLVISETNGVELAASSDQPEPLCLLTGMPPNDYKFDRIRKVKIAKSGYGSVNDVIPLLVDQARELGADAVINYNGAQRFGFWPWQFVRPTAAGLAIRWNEPKSVDCKGIGGTYKTRLNGPLTTDA
ncbi:MAG: hypothetical protein KUG81_02010 [Gammaproteobacteria bacterium]|nr:hypothetical protein [Gammaproteobacteria bacterium]